MEAAGVDLRALSRRPEPHGHRSCRDACPRDPIGSRDELALRRWQRLSSGVAAGRAGGVVTAKRTASGDTGKRKVRRPGRGHRPRTWRSGRIGSAGPSTSTRRPCCSSSSWRCRRRSRPDARARDTFSLPLTGLPPPPHLRLRSRRRACAHGPRRPHGRGRALRAEHEASYNRRAMLADTGKPPPSPQRGPGRREGARDLELEKVADREAPPSHHCCLPLPFARCRAAAPPFQAPRAASSRK